MKPREFWVPEDYLYESADACLTKHPEQAASLVADHQLFDVADELRMENEKYRKAIDEITNGIPSEWAYAILRKERDELTEQNKIMREALEYYKQSGEHFGSNDGGARASKALEKCGSIEPTNKKS